MAKAFEGQQGLCEARGWVRKGITRPCYRVSVRAPRGVSVFVGGRGVLKAHA